MPIFWNEEDNPSQDEKDNFSIYGDVPGTNSLGTPEEALSPEEAADRIIAKYRAKPPTATQQVISKAKEYGGKALGAFGEVVGAQKRGIDWLARKGAEVATGVAPPPETTAEGMLRDIIYPEDPSRGGLLDYRYKTADPVTIGTIAAMAAQGVPGLSVAPKSKGLARAVPGDIAEFATAMGLDPVTYEMAAASAPTRAEAVSQKILSRYGPVAPELSEKLTANLVRSPARKIAEKALHRGFQGQMALGAYEKGKESIGKLAKGDTKGAVRDAIQAGLSGAMVAGPPILKAISDRARSEALNAARDARRAELGSSFAPDEPLPIDAVPAEGGLRDRATALAVEIGKKRASDPTFNPVETPVPLPEELEPFRAPILQQAAHEAASVIKGRELIDQWRQEYGDQGPLDVQKVEDTSGDPSNYVLLQRAKDAQGRTRIVGGAKVDGNALSFITGGKGVDSPVSARPLYETLDTLGVKRAEFLSPMGLRARRKFAAEQAPPAEPAPAPEALPSLAGAEPAYAVEPKPEPVVPPVETPPVEALPTPEVIPVESPKAELPPLRDTLVKLYPENTYIKELPNGEGFHIALPNKREITIRPGVDAIEIDANKFEEANGRKLKPTDRAVGVTYRLPNSAVVEMVEGAAPRVLYHEQWHVLKHLASLTEEQNKKLQALYPNEEAQANAFADWMEQTQRPRHTVFSRILDALQSVYEWITGTGKSAEQKAAEGVFSEAASRGLVEPPPEGPPGLPEPAYAATPGLPGPQGQPPTIPPLGEPPALPGAEPPPPAPPEGGLPPSIEYQPGPIRRSTGNPPRVEERVSSLKQAVNEQRDLGIPAQDLVLDRDARRSWKDIEPEVQDVLRNWNDDKIFATIKRRHLDDYEVQALDAVTRARREAKDDARVDYLAAKESGNAEAATKAWGDYVKSIASYAALERASVNDGTGLARALAARARIMEADRTPDAKFLRQVLREIKGVSGDEAARLTQMFETGDPNLATALRAHLTGNAKKFWTLWRANLIGIPSEFANHAGNIMTQGVELGDKAAAAGVDWVISKLRRTGRRERYGAEVGAEIGGMLNAAPEALKKYADERLIQIYKRAWKGESREIQPGTPLEYQVSPFESKAGRLLATSLDALGVADDAAQAIIYPGELAARSMRLAIQRLGKPKGAEVEAEAQRILADVNAHPEKYESLIRSAKDASMRRVYREKPWSMVQHLQQLEKAHPWLAVAIPFVKTPANIARYSIRHLPTGILGPEVLNAFSEFKKGKISQGEFADVLAPRVTGTLLFGMFAAMAQAGLLTGKGPTDPKERKALFATGWQPYSLKLTVNDKHVYIPYSRFDPVANIIGIAADLSSINDSKDFSDAVSRGIGSVVSNITDKTYLRGLGDIATAYTDPKQYLASWLGNTANVITPNVLDKLAIAIDPKFRDVKPTDRGLLGLPKRMINVLFSQLPFASETLPARHSPTGEESIRPGGEGVAGGLARFFLPSIPTLEKPGTELESMLAKIHYVPSVPRPFLTVAGVQIPLRREELDALTRADKAAATEVRRMMRSPSFDRMPDTIEEAQGRPSKESVIKKVFAKHRNAAREMLWRSTAFRMYARQQLPRGKLPT